MHRVNTVHPTACFDVLFISMPISNLVIALSAEVATLRLAVNLRDTILRQRFRRTYT